MSQEPMEGTAAVDASGSGDGRERRSTVILDGVSKQFRQGDHTIDALVDVTLRVEPGEVVVIHGRSGSGKTTLLNIIGGLERADEGRVEVCGTDVTRLSESGRAGLRRHQVSYVFQAFGLLPVLSAAENVEVPLRLLRVDPEERRRRVAELLEAVGLAGRARHRPGEMSGGEQQRVAVARALASDPQLVVADEPTGQLDHATGQAIMSLLTDLAQRRGLAMLMASHDQSLIDRADRSLSLRDGRLATDDAGP
jgi:putative ABC transport system ATP-binding protein